LAEQRPLPRDGLPLAIALHPRVTECISPVECFPILTCALLRVMPLTTASAGPNTSTFSFSFLLEVWVSLSLLISWEISSALLMNLPFDEMPAKSEATTECRKEENG
jgi:hypothetical protein